MTATPTVVRRPRGRPKRGSGLWPREHGAYAQLLFPMSTVALVAGGSLPSGLLSLSLVAAFLANEPLLVLFGHRGKRAQAEWSARAKVRAAWLSALALLSGAAAFLLTTETARWALVPLVGLGVAVGLLMASKREKTSYGEVTVSLTLAYSAVPIGLAAGAGVEASSAIAGTWAIVYLLGLSTVHAILRRAKARDERLARAVIGVGTITLLLATWLTVAGYPVALASAPTPVAALWLVGSRVGPKRLRTVGWSLVAANVASLTLLAVVLRLSCG